MTVEEMTEAINDRCNSDCENCVIDSICSSVHGDFARHPKECEEAYNLMFDNPVTHPSHYTQGNIQCIDAMESAFGKDEVAIWCKLNAFKYVWREKYKNGIQDIDKAIWYLNKYKELSSSG